MSDKTIEDGVIVGITYVLTDADTGEALEKTPETEPFAYLHGAGSAMPGLETGLAGKSEGDAFDLTLEAADGYGERTGPGPQMVKRSQFRRDIPIREGMRFKAPNSAGEDVNLWVTKVAGSRIYIDSEHPLVGRRLHFVGTVALVRDATEVEVQHGHAHGLHGNAQH